MSMMPSTNQKKPRPSTNATEVTPGLVRNMRPSRIARMPSNSGIHHLPDVVCTAVVVAVVIVPPPK
jgi:hypothetical protein